MLFAAGVCDKKSTTSATAIFYSRFGFYLLSQLDYCGCVSEANVISDVVGGRTERAEAALAKLDYLFTLVLV